jgi:hypothetical protein
MSPQYAAKADGNQPEIVDELRARGFLVSHTHALGHGKPDIVVGGYHFGLHCNVLLWVEIKMPGAKLTEMEEVFHKEWEDMPVTQAFSARDILDWFGYE